ncbi:hypothetical protein SS50377_22347 [Spironucleus salmonicida]|uniref:Uncharacterized protein n=1 Tax=Spironucleus salmonicida TaxID=348837 RepID=V6LD59_9EUKA|nr:hypothetical protein SS50377_22347 [Spironucleus salmonicida]|eukprot:EST42158.1 Hypothetical protein SS50377_18465 [Spironucleus salmonicida]
MTANQELPIQESVEVQQPIEAEILTKTVEHQTFEEQSSSPQQILVESSGSVSTPIKQRKQEAFDTLRKKIELEQRLRFLEQQQRQQEDHQKSVKIRCEKMTAIQEQKFFQTQEIQRLRQNQQMELTDKKRKIKETQEVMKQGQQNSAMNTLVKKHITATMTKKETQDLLLKQQTKIQHEQSKLKKVHDEHYMFDKSIKERKAKIEVNRNKRIQQLSDAEVKNMEKVKQQAEKEMEMMKKKEQILLLKLGKFQQEDNHIDEELQEQDQQNQQQAEDQPQTQEIIQE